MMKTNEGIVINTLGDGGVSIRSSWHENGRNIIIKGSDFEPNILFNVIQNLMDEKRGKSINNIYLR